MFNYFTSPGKILKEYIDARDLKQSEVAKLIGTNDRQISLIINSKASISAEMAINLEKVFPDIKAEFWLNLETAYKLFLLRNKTEEIDDLEVISKEYKFNEVFNGLDYDIQTRAQEMLKLLNVNSFAEANKISSEKYAFMHDGGDEKAILIWVQLCQELIDIQNDLTEVKTFSLEKLKESMPLIKKLLNTTDWRHAIGQIRKVLNKVGIVLVVRDALSNSKIRGAVKKFDNYYAVYLSTRLKRVDSLYFTLIHEIAHIINQDLEKEGHEYLISYDESLEEKKSNEFARKLFLEEREYQLFVKHIKQVEKINDSDIIAYAKSMRVIPDIVVGFLSHDGIIKWNQFNQLITRIEGE